MSYTPRLIAPEVYWVGALNPNLRIFDIIMRTEQGTTYNAYLVKGKEKNALIDTVKQGFSQELFERVEKIVPLAEIDYLIANHLEPDHSGSILTALSRMPKARMVVSKNGLALLKAIHHQDVRPLGVGTGDCLDLGGKTLEFITAPFLHWPDTMFTYLPEDGILFPCDFLGSHFCQATLFEDQVGDFSSEFKYYYEHIMRPFKAFVLKGLESIRHLNLRMIAPSHGPILNRNLQKYLELYRQWSSNPVPVPEGSLVVFFASAYDMTGQLAKALVEGARATGIKVTLYDLVSPIGKSVADEVEAADGIAVGSTTINGDAAKPVWELLSSLATINLKGKWAVAFGSYGWSGEAVPMIEERLKSLKFKLAAPGLKVRFAPLPADLAAAAELGKTLALKIKAPELRGCDK